jgi:uncharacterized protein
MEVFGYIGALIMGLTLGLIGGGGSILTMPILVYLFGLDAVLATAYSLFIVGFTSLMGSISHLKHRNIDWKTALIFGVPSVISVYLTRLFLMPNVPETIKTDLFTVNKSFLILIIFAVLMLLTARGMIKKSNMSNASNFSDSKYKYPLIFMEGSLVGLISGFVGAGGGFLIIPALVILAKLPMKKAIGTSLIIIALKSLIGFTGDLSTQKTIDWHFLLYFSAVATSGILIGTFFSKKIPDEKLKPAFGYFVLFMGIYIISKELLTNHFK